MRGTHRVDLNLPPTKARERPRVNGDVEPPVAKPEAALYYREFPPEILRRLEHLAFVKDPDDLGAKYAQAIEAIDERQVRRQIFDS